MKEYDNYYKTKSKMLLNVHKAVIRSLINHGVLEQDDNINNALKILDDEIELKKNENIDKFKLEYDCILSKEEN